MTHFPMSLEPTLHVVLIIPCLNEEQNLASTCASLGFGVGSDFKKTNAILFIIDNNSTDLTVKVAEQVRFNSPNNTVFIGREQEKGYVPPRHKGALMAKEYAQFMGWALEEVLILQIDADTHYSDDYIMSMGLASKRYGLNTFIEANVDYPPNFKAEYPDYISLCVETDHLFVRLFARDLSDDYVIDDKVSGYRLSDYFAWGSHAREFNEVGEEIHAETTRLYMKAKLKGARREFANNALAFHSPRKIFQEALSHFATAGFPREASWYQKWQRTHDTINNLHEISSSINPDIKSAIQSRKQHLLALFSALPLHVDRALGENSSIASKEFTSLILLLLPIRTKMDLLSRPSIFLLDVFEMIELHGDSLVDSAYGFCL